VLATVLAGCAGKPPSGEPVDARAGSRDNARGETPGGSGTDAPVKAGWSEEGVASYYGNAYEGRRTASGEKYSADAMTAAHPTLPFGTRVRVTRLDTGKTVVVRINDRGPFRKGRVIDLSLRAARELGFVDDGLTRVRLRLETDP